MPIADDLAGSIGGEFAFGPARQELSAGATLLALGLHKDAARHAQAAISLHEELPAAQRWTGGLHGARVDLATAHSLDRDLDAASEVLAPTLALAPEQRTERVTARMRALRRHLSVGGLQASPRASGLAEQIEEFTATATSWPAQPGR